MYHISPSTGNPNICRAQDGNCPFASDEDHYETKAEAREAFESKQNDAASTKPLKKAPQKNPGLTRPKPEQVVTNDDSPFDGRLVSGKVSLQGDAKPSLAMLQDGSIEVLEPKHPLAEMTEHDKAVDKQRREMVESLSKAMPLASVKNADFPIDEARDFISRYPDSDLQDVAEAAFTKTLAGTNIDLKDQLFRAAAERGQGLRGATLNEYVAYADLVEVVRQPGDATSIGEPKTEQGRAVAEAKNPMSQAIYTFRGKSEIDPKVARDVLEQTFPNMVSGLSDEARAKVFSIAQERGADWGETVQEYDTAARVAAAAKPASKRETPMSLPRNYEQAANEINDVEQARRFLENERTYASGRGENVRATIEEISAELREKFWELR